MLTELGGKGGKVCQHVREGRIQCPLIVRPTSEDVITGELFGALRVLNPRWWLPDLLNRGLGANRFRRQMFRQLRVQLWQRRQRLPAHLLPWREGSTEVDAVITWENPPTTVFIEMKYRSNLSPGTANNSGGGQHPGDQLIRNARVGLWESGWYDEETLFDLPPRDFVLLLVAPEPSNYLVRRYRDPARLRKAIPNGDRLTRLPRTPFIGELSYREVVDLLGQQRRWFSRPEQLIVDQLREYLNFKLDQMSVPRTGYSGPEPDALFEIDETIPEDAADDSAAQTQALCAGLQ